MTASNSVRVPMAMATLVILAATACSDGLQVERVDGKTTADHAYVIPAGTAKALAAGESVDVLPAELTARVNEVMSIENRDDHGHLVGPFFVPAKSTLRERFSSPGTFVGNCDVHPSGRFTLTIVP